MECPKCGTYNTKASNFCANCGGKLTEEDIKAHFDSDDNKFRNIDEKDKSSYNLIHTTNLKKSYKKREVVKDVSFQMKRGEVVGPSRT